MTDLVKLTLRAGNGGNGRVSFRREKFIPKGGPDGGQGGKGGSVIIRATRQLTTLSHFAGAKEYKAEPGQAGGMRKMTGRQGEDIVLEVPLGTVIWMLAENPESHRRTRYLGVERARYHNEMRFEKFFLAQEGAPIPPRELEGDAVQEFSQAGLSNIDLKTVEKQELVVLKEDGQEVIVCQGGFGGRGNESFKGSTNTTPLEAEYGTPGEIKVVLLELKLLADVGLVGFPNAGKSSLISRLTQARPKIASYPFTTLEPNLGVMAHKEREVVIADIPGLIEGASEGKGLGYTFLRHVENSTALLFVVSLDEVVVFDTSLSEADKAAQLVAQYDSLLRELAAYNELVAHKRSLVVLNKIDMYSKELIDDVSSLFKQKSIDLIPMSAATGEGEDKLRDKILETVSDGEV